jgi:hypothetical protein
VFVEGYGSILLKDVVESRHVSPLSECGDSLTLELACDMRLPFPTFPVG